MHDVEDYILRQILKWKLYQWWASLKHNWDLCPFIPVSMHLKQSPRRLSNMSLTNTSPKLVWVCFLLASQCALAFWHVNSSFIVFDVSLMHAVIMVSDLGHNHGHNHHLHTLPLLSRPVNYAEFCQEVNFGGVLNIIIIILYMVLSCKNWNYILCHSMWEIALACLYWIELPLCFALCLPIHTCFCCTCTHL